MLHVTEPNSQLLWSHVSELKEHIQRCCSYPLWSAHTWPCGPFWGPSTVAFKEWMALVCSYWHRPQVYGKEGGRRKLQGFLTSLSAHTASSYEVLRVVHLETPCRSALDATQIWPAGSYGNPASAGTSGWCYTEGLGAIGLTAANPSLDGFHFQTCDLFDRRNHVQAVCGRCWGSGPAPLSPIGGKPESTEEYRW